MHRNEYRRMAHEEVEEIFREILPQAGMKVREEQITLCHQMLSSLCGNKIALCDAAVGVGKTYAYLVACILFRKYSQLLSGYFSMCGQSQPIVISTSSIALQEAIQREYIPLSKQSSEKGKNILYVTIGWSFGWMQYEEKQKIHCREKLYMH